MNPDKLKGKTIKSVRPMNDIEMKATGFYKRPFVILFTDGSALVPQSDDEGNDGGAIMYLDKDPKEDFLLGTN